MRSSSDLPPALPTLRHSMRLAYRAEPRLLVVSLALVILIAASDGLFAWWLKLLADGVAESRDGLVLGAALGLAGSTAGGWLLRMLGERVDRAFRMRIGLALEAHVADLQSSIPTIEHHERPAYIDRLDVLRNGVSALDHMYAALFNVAGTLLRLLIVLGLLVSVHPAMLLLVAFAVPTVAVASWRAGIRNRIDEQIAPHQRLAHHLFALGSSAAPAKEIRLAGLGRQLIVDHGAARAAWYGPMASHLLREAWSLVGAWALFGLAYVGAVSAAATVLNASAGDVLLVLAAGGRLAQYVSTTAGETSFLRMWLESSKRLAWLEKYADAHRDTAELQAPNRLTSGIRLQDVSFRYPGTEPWVLQNLTLELPAGSVVALVGDNGAGKTTLVKLLSKFYEPTRGRILVDGIDLSRIPATTWRSRLAGAYQDFFNFEFPARGSIGVGDLPRMDSDRAVATAADRAGAGDVIDQLPQGLQTQLGRAWDGGVDLSFGQWQKLALARGFMRDQPLLLVLDEPTAALDAETEHALFERYSARSDSTPHNGRITLLVSHRFSTVRMADLIVVIQGTRVIEVGSHNDLMTRGGTYAELYTLQARAYR